MANRPVTPKIHLTVFCLLSCLSHAIACAMLSNYGHYEFVRPVDLLDAVRVELTSAAEPPPPHRAKADEVPQDKSLHPHPCPTASPPVASETSAGERQASISPEAAATEVTTSAPPAAAPTVEQESKTPKTPSPNGPAATGQLQLPSPIRNNDEFVKGRREKLSYLVSLHGLPIGTAQVEAANRNGELRIRTSARSHPALSMIYPVDNVTETRMFNGRYIMTTIKQREGSFRKDFGFTINLGEKNVFWADRLRERYGTEPVPTDQTVDIMAGFFYLRNQQLEVGKSVVLHLYDSNTYTPTEVQILRRETVSLPGSGEVATLVIRPMLLTDGIFRRTGEMFIWVTDDQFKVPVRMEASIPPLGTVTAELVSAEVER